MPTNSSFSKLSALAPLADQRVSSNRPELSPQSAESGFEPRFHRWAQTLDLGLPSPHVRGTAISQSHDLPSSRNGRSRHELRVAPALLEVDLCRPEEALPPAAAYGHRRLLGRDGLCVAGSSVY